jgi:uncharacterized glyoxalase superfamily protein PhnB
VILMGNRSVPVDTVLPHLFYEDVAGALAWLTEAFGFQEHYRYGDPERPSGAQLRAGNAYVMVSEARPGRGSPDSLGVSTQSLTIFVDDVDGHHDRAVAAGARVVEELNETVYGEYQYGVLDLGGHSWLFSRHAKDLDPADWGAKVNR